MIRTRHPCEQNIKTSLVEQGCGFHASTWTKYHSTRLRIGFFIAEALRNPTEWWPALIQ